MKFGKMAILVSCVVLAGMVFGEDLSAEAKKKVDTKIKQYSAWSTDAKIVEAVKAYNDNPPAEFKDMTQEKWKELTVLSPEVKSLVKNELGLYIKSLKDSVITEFFVSAANGNKVAFLSKTTGWCHKGKPKHDTPMTGKTWIGSVEVDESSGQRQVQVSLPVLDKGKPIGSMVIGLGLNKLQ